MHAYVYFMYTLCLMDVYIIDICVSIYVYGNIHMMHMQICIHCIEIFLDEIHIFKHIYIYTCIYIYICRNVLVYYFLYIYLYIFIYIHIYVCIDMHICKCLCEYM
jgi:hypothetical protein